MISSVHSIYPTERADLPSDKEIKRGVDTHIKHGSCQGLELGLGQSLGTELAEVGESRVSLASCRAATLILY